MEDKNAPKVPDDVAKARDEEERAAEQARLLALEASKVTTRAKIQRLAARDVVARAARAVSKKAAQIAAEAEEKARVAEKELPLDTRTHRADGIKKLPVKMVEVIEKELEREVKVKRKAKLLEEYLAKVEEARESSKPLPMRRFHFPAITRPIDEKMKERAKFHGNRLLLSLS